MERQSNFELLRIISCILIFAGHFSGQGLCLNQSEVQSHIYLLFSLFTNAPRIGVGIFLFIGVFFLVDKKFSFSRILTIYGTMWFYSVLIMILYKFVFKQNITFRYLISSFIPFWGQIWWFPNVYILLLLMHPILNVILELSENKIRFIILILLILIPFRFSLHGLMDSGSDSFVWFCFSYLFIGYYKKYIHLNNFFRNLYFFSGLIIYCLLCLIKVFDIFGVGRIAAQYLADFKSFPNLFITFSIFVFFEKLEFKSKVVNKLAKGCFGVYLIHQVPYFYPYLWSKTINQNFVYSLIQKSNWYILIYTLAYVLIMFMCFIVFDLFRQCILDPIWKKSKVFIFLNNKVNSYYYIMYENLIEGEINDR
ncbi:acyltransferase family protein [Treponema bryantii]|uniref:acyltransferase family protein n=1 Tax=Treponema bryantii TaxID=163 RepID=UPI0003B612EC|nr:acyltransferase family protein [Treponema bryantii]